VHGATTNSACSFEAEGWQGKPGIQYDSQGVGRRKGLGSVVVRLIICCGGLSFYKTAQFVGRGVFDYF
jgi:hypothetical protein